MKKLNVYAVIILTSFTFVQCQANKIDNAFVTLNDKLSVSENLLIEKSHKSYDLFDEMMNSVEEIEMVKPWNSRANRIRNNSNDISNFLILECSAMISLIEEKDLHGTDAEGNLILLDLSEIKHKDNYDVPTFMFASEGGGKLRGQELRKSIHRYRDSICYIMANYSDEDGDWTFKPTFDGESLVEFDLHATVKNRNKLNLALESCNPKDTAKIANVYLSLSQPAFYENHNEIYSWEMTMFDHAPVVAAGTMFSAFIVDVRNAESAAVDFLYSKVVAPVFNFNKIEPLEFNSLVDSLQQEDTIPLSVKIAAFDLLDVAK